MSIVSLFLIVCLGILIFIAYFHISNFILDHFVNNKSKKFSHETSIRAVIFIAPAFIVLFIFILYPVFETVRLSFYDKFGREFVGLYNYIWALKDPEFRGLVFAAKKNQGREHQVAAITSLARLGCK